MIIVHSISTGAFEPISFGTNYLYSQYDKIQSFLLKNYGPKYKNILAKPILSGTEVNWYANFNSPLSRLSDLSEETQEKIKIEYWDAKNNISNDINALELAKEAEKKNWAKLLTEVFNDENNVILSDGTNWCLLWGWQFRNKQENYLAPSFLPNVIPKNDVVPIIENVVEPVIIEPINTAEEIVEIIEIPIEDNFTDFEDVNLTGAKVKPTLWDKIKRFLRRLVYKIWGLLYLIMIMLFLCCLCKRCAIERCKVNCYEINNLDSKLISIEKKVQDNCATK